MARFFWSFLFYSFFGFILEVLFARITRSNKQDRKCMYFLPLCPVYGLGALLIVSLPVYVQTRPALLFLSGALAATLAEYVTDWACERALGVRFWDYSAMPWNLNGRVCLPFSLAWGLLALSLTGWLHPIVTQWISATPASWTLPAVLFFLLDSFFTVLLLRTTKDTSSLRWYDRFRRTAGEHS